jgi:hypothetical protein
MSTFVVLIAQGRPATSFDGPAATGTGVVAASFQGGGDGCGFTRSALGPAPASVTSAISTSSLPEQFAFPHGLVDFRLSGCAEASTLNVTLTLPLRRLMVLCSINTVLAQTITHHIGIRIRPSLTVRQSPSLLPMAGGATMT